MIFFFLKMLLLLLLLFLFYLFPYYSFSWPTNYSTCLKFIYPIDFFFRLFRLQSHIVNCNLECEYIFWFVFFFKGWDKSFYSLIVSNYLLKFGFVCLFSWTIIYVVDVLLFFFYNEREIRNKRIAKMNQRIKWEFEHISKLFSCWRSNVWLK